MTKRQVTHVRAYELANDDGGYTVYKAEFFEDEPRDVNGNASKTTTVIGTFEYPEDAEGMADSVTRFYRFLTRRK